MAHCVCLGGTGLGEGPRNAAAWGGSEVRGSGSGEACGTLCVFRGGRVLEEA